MKREEIQQIAPEHLVDGWLLLDPTVYYKDSKPYGMLGTLENDDMVYIFSATSKYDKPFTKNMIRDIIRLYKHNDVCLITDHEPSQEQIRNALTRYGFTFQIIDKVLYSYHFLLKD